ncbi:APC family permease [Herbidospora galbida]|uniref:APC family permease n=1 Tax=Herbidospora galbida TaxID=2575442 RepID=A0A4U3LSP8_9ACTN|nr:APC family permease [Herbidospora galbida]TKK79025.1 APC family permease [Herbidospora galbida]
MRGVAVALRGWLLNGLTADRSHLEQGPEEKHAWWRVMCLTGVDYFSTLGYQPGIAALAAGALSPVATLFLVALTLFGALPVYRYVAGESPHGAGSIAMLERLVPAWQGKLFVLCLLGFAATDFVITMTLSAADATAHIMENPFAPHWLEGQRIPVTLVLLAALGAIFLAGFTEAVGVATALVALYLALNAVVVGVAVERVAADPAVFGQWDRLLEARHASPLAMIGLALLVMPRLALGLSGFETGVAVMPVIRGDIPQRIRSARTMLTTAALIMSGFLLLSSFVTTLLIPAHEFQPDGKANGRALAYLAHAHLGEWFGTLYDVSTIAILWFAGASAMAGLINLVPRFLPRYGMAPEWASAVRPLVLILTVIAFVITFIFDADVDQQAGAYATGVLVLMLSAAVASCLSTRAKGRRRAAWAFGVISAVLTYTLVDNVIERPDGVKIAGFFIVAIVVTSLISRATRSTELRVTRVRLDPLAEEFVNECCAGELHLIANEPQRRDQAEYNDKLRENWFMHRLRTSEQAMFVEVTINDASEFETELYVRGEERFGHKVLNVESSTVPNALAALLLYLRDRTGRVPNIYFHWTEGNPINAMLRYLIFGGGDVPPLTREVLRLAEPDPLRRPHVHVG